MGAFRHPNALLPGSETRVDFFATNACNLPKYALEHVWECFWAFGSGTKNDAKRVHFGTRVQYCGVEKSGGLFYAGLVYSRDIGDDAAVWKVCDIFCNLVYRYRMIW